MAEGSLQTRTSSPAGPEPPSSDEARRAYLLVFDGDTSRTFALPTVGAVVAGRAEDAALRLPSTSVSRHHARFDASATGVRVTDLGSHNGTLVNGERVTEPVPLVRGDVVSLGEVTLVLLGTGAGAASSALLDAQALRQRLHDEVARAVAHDRKLSLLWIDLPPGVEPTAGAATLSELLRPWDVAGVGTEGTLVLLLPEADDATARAIGRRVAARLERVAPIACPLGLATCPRDGCDAAGLLAGARAAARLPSRVTTDGVADAQEDERLLHAGDRSILVGEPAMERTYDLVRRLAAADLAVLVVGETGSGKDLVAAALHHWSKRAKGPLVALNCAALAESLVESELFGFARGAFSGAAAAKAGLLEAAAGGTVFLDEVGELPLAVQAKLLRVLETKRATRLGEVTEREVDVRVVAATNRDLEADVRSGRFRADLYYRLGAATVWVPPLRDRPRELPGLARQFLRKAGDAGGRPPLLLSDGALRALAGHSWPGNVRELKNVMDTLAATVAGDLVTADHVAERLAGRGAPIAPAALGLPGAAPAFRPIDEEVRELERRRMTEALQASGGHQPRAAALLGMPLRTFYTKAKLYGLRAK